MPNKINLVSDLYQFAYYQATMAAATTGDEVFEVENNDGSIAFVTGHCLRILLKLQQNNQIKLIKSALKIV